MLHKRNDLKGLTECGIKITATQNDEGSLPYPLIWKAAAG